MQLSELLESFRVVSTSEREKGDYFERWFACSSPMMTFRSSFTLPSQTPLGAKRIVQLEKSGDLDIGRQATVSNRGRMPESAKSYAKDFRGTI